VGGITSAQSTGISDSRAPAVHEAAVVTAGGLRPVGQAWSLRRPRRRFSRLRKPWRDELKKFVNRVSLHTKYPRWIEFVADLPNKVKRTDIKRFKLRAAMQSDQLNARAVK